MFLAAHEIEYFVVQVTNHHLHKKKIKTKRYPTHCCWIWNYIVFQYGQYSVYSFSTIRSQTTCDNIKTFQTLLISQLFEATMFSVGYAFDEEIRTL